PSFMPARSPFGPSATCSTSGGPGNEVKMTSHSAASAFGLSVHTAPAARWRSAAARRMSWTTSSYPAFCRLAAMLAPIVPSPIKPTFICVLPYCPSLAALHTAPTIRQAARRFWGSSPQAHSLSPLAGRGLGGGAISTAMLQDRAARLPRREDVLGDLRRGPRRRPAGVGSEVRD